MRKKSFDNIWLFDHISNVINLVDSKVEKILKPHFRNFATLSNFLDKYDEFIYDYRKRHRRFQIFSIKILKGFRKAIENHFIYWKQKYFYLRSELNDAESKLLSYIDKYENLHQPKNTPNSQIKNYHPNIKLDYFKIINTKQKAYWLGFLYADGYIAKRKKNGKYIYRTGIAVNIKDKYIVKRFCDDIGGNPAFIKTEKIKSISGKYANLVRFRFVNNKFAKYLIQHGCYSGKGKAKRIKLPVLGLSNTENQHKLYLAFLLGFYDGDGTLLNNSQARIYSSSKKFLQEIKDYFHFKTTINYQETEIYDPNRKITFLSRVYVLTIPKSVFKTMMLNYHKSLLRKRIPLSDFGYKKRDNKTQNWIKRVIDRKTLIKLINTLPLSKIACLLKIHVSTFKKVLIDYNIETKPSHFWSSKVLASGHSIDVPEKYEKLLKNLAETKTL